MKIIGVMGPGEKESKPEDLDCAYEVGKIVANTGAALLCGGMKGTMETSAKGAKDAGGITIGIGPTGDKSDQNDNIELKLVTNMHAGRNYMNVASSDLLIFVSVGSPGTLSELAHAIQQNIPSIIIRGSDKLQAYMEEFDSNNINFVSNLEELSEKLTEILDS